MPDNAVKKPVSIKKVILRGLIFINAWNKCTVALRLISKDTRKPLTSISSTVIT